MEVILNNFNYKFQRLQYLVLLLLAVYPLRVNSNSQWGHFYSPWITTESPPNYNPYALQHLDPRTSNSDNSAMPRWLDTDLIYKYCKCTSLDYCPAAVGVLRRTPSDTQELDLLRRLTCSFQGFHSSVCCNILVESLIYIRSKKKRAYFSYGGYNGGRGGGYGGYGNYNWNENNNHPTQPTYDIDERYSNSNENHFYWDQNYFPRWSHDPSETRNNGHYCGYPHGDKNYNRKPTKRPKIATTTSTTEEPYIIDVVEPEKPELPPEVPTTSVEPVPEAPVATDPPPVPETTAEVVVVPSEPTIESKIDVVPDARAAKRALFNEQVCGTKIESRIVGGEDANLGDYPWMARLGYRRNIRENVLFRCGGTLINNRYVVTAAHCTTNLPSGLELVLIRLGEYDERSNPDCAEGSCADPPQDVNYESIVVHSSYNTPRLANDIALIRLAQDIQFSSYITPLCLPFQDSQENVRNLTGLLAVVAGWGSTNTGFTSGSPVLRWVRLRIIPAEECVTGYRRFNITVSPEQQICTGGLENMDACEGDSGGPLFLESTLDRRATLIGIVSFGARRCGTAAVPGVYTRVESYMDWILDTIS